MKKIVCLLLSLVMMFCLFSVAASGEELGTFEVFAYGGEDKAVITWDAVDNAEYYEVFVDTTDEYFSFNKIVNDTYLEWFPYDVMYGAEFDIKVVAYSEDKVKICESNPLKVTVGIMNFDYWSYYGDTDLDLEITVLDASKILSYIAKKISLENAKLSASDVNSDGAVTVLDATIIQRLCAGLPVFEDSKIVIGAPFFYGGFYYEIIKV